ncbi:MAG: nicotinate (nicotinamide) nucleotide adenylyltransferase [Eubacterium sp.]|nr:nicotinate (nicotinamide) nucleotide adenylyltransferase [Eubacterium sp.]
MKIGLLGGTFDPVHNTHIDMAKEVLKGLKLDKVYLMPSFCPPHKNSAKITSECHRIHMIKLAVEELDNIEYCDFEIKNKLSYTADTLTAWKEQYPEDELYFIIGGDSVSSFDNWYHPEIILEKATLVVIRRNDLTLDSFEKTVKNLTIKYHLNTEETSDYQRRLVVLDTNVSGISSSFIRNHPLNECKDLLPVAVYEYIHRYKLYMNEDVNMAWSVAEIKNDLQRVLKETRYVHTLGVARTAKDMAEAFDINPNQAYLAGLLHDCAKHFSNEQLIETCVKNNIMISKYEKNAPYLLHGKVGAYIAGKKYYIEDRQVLNAVKWHTTGRPDMTKLEQIIFCADYIEPSRSVQPNLSYLRQIAMKDLDLLTYHILKDTLNYLQNKNQLIDSFTKEAYEFYKEKIGEK